MQGTYAWVNCELKRVNCRYHCMHAFDTAFVVAALELTVFICACLGEYLCSWCTQLPVLELKRAVDTSFLNGCARTFFFEFLLLRFFVFLFLHLIRGICMLVWVYSCGSRARNYICCAFKPIAWTLFLFCFPPMMCKRLVADPLINMHISYPLMQGTRAVYWSVALNISILREVIQAFKLLYDLSQSYLLECA